jgi:hypothetical protein
MQQMVAHERRVTAGARAETEAGLCRLNQVDP